AAGTINLNAGGALALGSLVDGSSTSIGAVSLAAGTTLTVTSGGGATFSGVVSGAGGLAMTGTGGAGLAGGNRHSRATPRSSRHAAADRQRLGRGQRAGHGGHRRGRLGRARRRRRDQRGQLR